VPGLFAAGDASDQMGCLHMCVAGGFAAGRHAADYARREGQLRPVEEKAIAAERARVFAPLARNAGVPYWELENIVRFVTTDHFGPVKTERSLTAALEKLDALDDMRERLVATNLHELMRVHEASNIQQVAKITASAALFRRESRFTPYHYRADFPETDDANWCGLVGIRKGDDGRAVTRFEPLPYAA
jgi:succinate dehydrogenase/fumarate reductase flavoprotein subunit